MPMMKSPGRWRPWNDWPGAGEWRGPTALRRAFVVFCLLTGFGSAALSANAEQPNFADLLARAEAQAAAGHRWGPPGDNMTETVLRMMELVPTATPDQLAELSALLQTEETTLPPGRKDTDSRENGPAGDGSGDGRPGIAKVPPARLATPEPAPPVPATRSTSGPVPSGSPPAEPLRQSAVADHPPLALPVPATPTTSQHAAELYARGKEAERRGDFSAARRFYLIAAEQGVAPAAMSLGRLYDPDYLRHTAVGGIDADPALARHWYERAVQLGDREAGPLLQALSAR